MKKTTKTVTRAFFFIPVIYFIVGGLCILLTNRLLPYYFGQFSSMEENVIDLAFVAATSLFLGMFIKRDLTQSKAILDNEEQLRTLINAVPEKMGGAGSFNEIRWLNLFSSPINGKRVPRSISNPFADVPRRMSIFGGRKNRFERKRNWSWKTVRSSILTR